MANPREVATADELMKLLRESGILGPAELRKADKIAAETNRHLTLARRLVAQKVITRWQAGQLLVGWTKLRLGKYVLRSQIGRGEYGRVFLATHPQLKREVAIKTLSRRFTGHQETVDQFLADAREVAALDHRNIVHIFDVDSGDDQYYMVMEYVRGSDLRRRVEEAGPLAVDVAANYLVQTAAGLAHAHQRDVIHRDLQPANLMVDHQGVVKIVGWGIGRLRGMQRSLDTRAGSSRSASESGYLAPEQSGDRDLSDARSDLYALGCTAHFLLVGQTPVSGDAPPVATLNAPTASPTDIAELRSDMPPGLAAVIRRMMAGDPDSRYASADEVMQDLRPWASAEPDAAAPAAIENPDASSDDSFDWAPATRSAGRVARATVSHDSAKSSACTGATRLSRRTMYVLYAALALFVLGMVGAVAYWWSRADRAPSWSGERSERPADAAPPRLRKRERPLAGGAWSDTHPTSPGDSEHATGRAADTALSGREDPVAGEPGPAAPAEGMAVPQDPPAPDPAGAPPLPNQDAGSAENAPAVAVPPPSTPESPPPPTEPPPKPEPPTATEPPANPWRDWPAAVDLPVTVPDADAPAASEPVDIAVLAAPLPVPVAATLLGGTTAGLRGTHYALVPTPSADADPPHWQIVAVGEKATEAASRVVAQLDWEDNRLRFRWDPGVAGTDAAAHLGNCVLRLTSGAHTHDLRLRRPLHADPLRIDLKKQSTAVRAKVPAPPDPKQVRFQITTLDAPLPSTHTLSPTTPIAVNEGKLQISLGPDAETQILLLELTPELKTVFQVECDAFFRLKPDTEPVVLVLKKVQLAEWTVARNQELANENAIALRNAVINTAPTDPALGTRQGQLQKADADLAECTKMTQRMAALAEIRSAVADGAAMEYRLFFLADDCEVELLRTDPGGNDEARDTQARTNDDVKSDE